MKVTNLFVKTDGNICVPLVGRTRDDILQQLPQIVDVRPDLIEWRIDYYENYQVIKEVAELLSDIRLQWGNRPLLLTLRTKNEGGQAEISPEDYLSLLIQYVTQLDLDLLDIEMMSVTDASELKAVLKNKNTTPVISYHNFYETLTEGATINLLKQMKTDYPDAIYKCAQMPKTFEEVLMIMAVGKKIGSKQPLIMVAMGELGKITRVLTKSMNNLVTFASVTQSSAPGQLEIHILRDLMAQLNH
ncbi:type I 3-dehydroquinate dehydratase [Vagococcus zengguangii]|uniref:type I 3-dehydroquinate dehydratase n=1 Tax=Vagococcus zengguangii TaxID=2571750 RepID=UPI001109A5F3|nr:type I 3-dehydroquinate dehydratase [Vagococcus zengguangii]TLG81401.1 type I 3-dehydroquinate dehydratase [Vagococcus zengguangii]